MCTIENKRIVLADFRLQFKKEWIGNALCSYEYNTAREGFKNILKIDLNIVYPLNKANSSTHKCFEVEVKFIEDFSQAFNLVKDYLNAECWGTEIINKAFRDISVLIDSRGMNNSTINSINSVLNSVEANITRMSSTVQSMTDSELTGFYVPWVDGRSLGIMTWIASFGTFMNKLTEEMESFIR